MKSDTQVGFQGRFERGQRDLAVALREMRVARVQAGAVYEYRQVQARAFDHEVDVEVAAEIPRRYGAQMLASVRRDADDAKERA